MAEKWGFWDRFAGWNTKHGYEFGFNACSRSCKTCARYNEYMGLFYLFASRQRVYTPWISTKRNGDLEIHINAYERGLLLRTGAVLDQLEWKI